MYRFLIISCAGLFLSLFSYGQADHWYPEHSGGVYISSVDFKLYDFKNKSIADEYQELFSNSSLESGLWYNKTLGRYSSVQFEFKNCSRYSIVLLDTLNLGINESFLEFPFLYKFVIASNRIGFNPVEVFCGLGATYSLLTKQNFYSPANQTLSDSYQEEIGFAQYSKVGIITDFGLTIDLSSNYAGVVLGYRSNIDATSFFKSKKVKETPNYWAYGFYLGLYMRFGKVKSEE